MSRGRGPSGGPDPVAQAVMEVLLGVLDHAPEGLTWGQINGSVTFTDAEVAAALDRLVRLDLVRKTRLDNRSHLARYRLVNAEQQTLF